MSTCSNDVMAITGNDVAANLCGLTLLAARAGASR
jgi:hypothetical protein